MQISLKPAQSTVPSPTRSTWTRALSKMLNRCRSPWKNRRSSFVHFGYDAVHLHMYCIDAVGRQRARVRRRTAHVFHGIVSQSLPRAADFTLTAHTGQPVRLSDFQGKLVLFYFGYTHCPGICPTTLAEVAQAFRTL